MDDKLDVALSGMILSASGWRGVFAQDGNEESPAPGILGEYRIIAAAAAKVFSDYLRKFDSGASGKASVIVGRDTRPTGEAIADAVIRSLLVSGMYVRYAGISAAPELMAFARASGISGHDSGALGFMYISASHNPIGHNGIKFGLTDGGVLQAGETALLAADFRSFMASPSRIEQARALLDGAGAEKLSAVYAAEEQNKKAALAAYWAFTEEVISGSTHQTDQTKRKAFFDTVRTGLEKHPPVVVADFNGSARTVSIDRDFFASLGIGFYGLNDRPGEIAHRIVPEGESLEPCRAFIEKLRRKEPRVYGEMLGYVPDCDGDRGNLVIWDEAERRARILEAQEVFALSCVAELASLVWTGELKYDTYGKALVKTALAVNDPTSLRIDRIGRAFDVPVFRAEVGEANVVGLARKLREQGYLVRILGEGSAGGTITHPSAVRDPIDTMGAILKLLAIRDGGETGCGLFEIWCGFSGQAASYREDFTLADIIASLPAFVTTGVYTGDAVLRVKTADHGYLKEKYQGIFLREWEEKKQTLYERFGISRWEAVAYNGTEERRNIARFGDAGKGGLKIEFRRNAEPCACIWMRGSGTEPVFRVMADASDMALERTLIEWQRKMVQEADNAYV